MFGLSGFKGALSITHPGGCADPGFTGDEGEAALDAEWTSAVAPSATIVEAACGGGTFGFGVMTSLMNLVEGGTTASAISVSYIGDETGNSLAFLDAWTNISEEAAAEGIPVFVSSGDGASDPADTAAPLAVNGLNVNGLATNPYVTAVGGTDFADTAVGLNANYWSSTNATNGGSAKSYIPEIPWDNSCSGEVQYLVAGASGAIANCNKVSPTSADDIYQDVVGGSGGQSLLFAKPSFQSGVAGIVADGVRDIPDISLFAANGLYNHFYLSCMSDAAEGGVPCDFANTADFIGSAAGGTSFAAPDFAGIAALVSQADGGRIGTMAPRLYQLAALQEANAILAKSCNADSTTGTVSRACIFYDVTFGDISAACQKGTFDCYTDAGSKLGVGVLSTSLTKLQPAFPATTGYDLATGLGSVNVTHLIVNY